MSNETDIEEIDCLEAIDNLYAYLDGELTADDTLLKFQHHLNHCQSCYSRSELEGIISERIKTSGKNKTPDSVKNRLHSLIEKL